MLVARVSWLPEPVLGTGVVLAVLVAVAFAHERRAGPARRRRSTDAARHTISRTFSAIRASQGTCRLAALALALLACAFLAAVLALAACGQSGPAEDVNVGTAPTAESSQASGSSEAGPRRAPRPRPAASRRRPRRPAAATASEGTTTARGHDDRRGPTTERGHDDGEARRRRRPSEATTGGATGDAAAGKDVFASAGCAGCHTLADAGATGNVGPEPRRPEAGRPDGRPEGHRGRWRHAVVRRPAVRAADPGRRGLRRAGDGGDAGSAAPRDHEQRGDVVRGRRDGRPRRRRRRQQRPRRRWRRRQQRPGRRRDDD